MEHPRQRDEDETTAHSFWMNENGYGPGGPHGNIDIRSDDLPGHGNQMFRHLAKRHSGDRHGTISGIVIFPSRSTIKESWALMRPHNSYFHFVARTDHIIHGHRNILPFR